MSPDSHKRRVAVFAALTLIATSAGATAALADPTHGDAGGGAGLSGGSTLTTAAPTKTTTVPAVTFTSPATASPSPIKTTSAQLTSTLPPAATRTTSPSTTAVTVSPVTPWASAPSSRGLDKLRRALKANIRRAGGSAGALVVDDTTGTVLFADKPSVRRLPASVEKLFTTATALFTLGADAHLTTSVLGRSAVSADGSYSGPLYLRGGGDPTFGDTDFDSSRYGKRVGATVQQLVAGLEAAGIRRVDGPIVADASYFDSLRSGPGTGYRPNLENEGELSGLIYDDGFSSGSETQLQAEPALWAGSALATAMRAGGIAVPKKIKIKTGRTPATANTLVNVQSPPLSTLIELTNSPSDDFFAETLLKDIGKHTSGVGSTAAGAAVVRTVMAQKLGVHPTVVDGSGLSRRDRTTAAEVVKLLQELRGDSAFYDSLAIAGVRGTMQEEMSGTRAVDNCRGKTGTLHDVANLAGYCTAANGDQLTFAFLLNGQRNSAVGHELEDMMGADLASYRP